MNIVDRLGAIAAAKADLVAEEKALKERLAQLAANGDENAFEGDLFRATVSFSEATRVDWKAVAEKLEPSRQLVTAHTSTTPRTTVRVSARKIRRAA